MKQLDRNAIDRSPFLQQAIPLSLTILVLGILTGMLYASLRLFNLLPVRETILLTIRPADVIVGMTIYFKTAIDFAVFMGRLMAAHTGWRNRIAIEIGSAAGNAIGTILIIGMWVVFKDIELLLAAMVLVAALVLFGLAHNSLEHIETWEAEGGIKRTLFRFLHRFLDPIKTVIDPVLSRIVPDLRGKLEGNDGVPWKRLLLFSGTVPFILGLDDFAGYVPLFSIVNVYGFSFGVFAAHTALNIALFLSPKRTIDAVRNDYVNFFGALAFVGIALYGIVDAGRIIASIFVH